MTTLSLTRSVIWQNWRPSWTVSLFCLLCYMPLACRPVTPNQRQSLHCTLRGTLSPQVRRRFIRPTPDGKVLQIQGSHQNLTIPLRSQFTYLGAQVSYHAFENQTLQYRLDKGTAAYSRLGSVLKARHHLNAQQRVCLWQSCVWSTISYGLTTCGLTPAGHKSLETTVLRHLRAILRVPVHLTHTTNADVARQAGVGLPHAILNRLLDTESDRKQASEWFDPLTYGPHSSWWQHLKTSLQPPVESIQLVAPDLMIKPYTCPTCGISYATRAAMLAHITKSHSDPTAVKAAITFDKAKDAIGGMPQCAACGKQFPTWHLLQRHVVGNYCAAKHADQPQSPAAPVVPTATRPELFAETTLQTLLTKHGANAIYHLTDRQVYAQHCMQCGQWIASSKATKLHYKHSHPDLLSAHASTALKLCASYTPCGSPCLYCNHPLAQPKAHKPQCSVLWQFCIGLVAHRDQHGISGDPNRGNLRITCEGECRRLWPAPVGGHIGGGSSHQTTQGQRREWTGQKTPSLLQWFQPGKQPPTGPTRLPEPGSQRPHATRQSYGSLAYQAGDAAPDPQTELCLAGVSQAGAGGTNGTLAPNRRSLPRDFAKSAHGGPLRAILLSTLFQALLTCLQNISSQPQQQQVVKDKVWMTPEGKWNYQRWHQENQCLQVDDSRAPMDHQEVIKHVGALVQAVQRKDVIHRFNATNGISASTESTTLFMLEIGLRAPGVEQVWQSLEALSHLSALQLCGMQLKREGLKRSSLANDVQKLLQQC